MSSRHAGSAFGALVFYCTVLAAAPRSAYADEIIRYKTTAHSTSSAVMDAADGVNGHVLGFAKFVGLSLFEDGRVATLAYIANFDYVNGSGTYVTLETLKFDDGSTIRMRHSGSTKVEGKLSVFADGKIEITGGEGRYKGVTGSGAYHGARILPISEGGDSYFDGTMTLKGP